MSVAAATPVRFDAALGAYVVTGYKAAEQVLRDPGWSSDIRTNLALVEQFGGAQYLPDVLTSMMLFTDDPTHSRLRRLVAPAFSARRMEAFRARVGEIIDAALAGLQEVDEFDLLSELSYPVTVAIISELLDVGPEGAELLIDETPKLAGLLEIAPTQAQLRDSSDAMMACVLFLLPILDERRNRPGDDFLSAVQQRVEGEQLSIEEALATTLLLLVAGHETTANLIANGVLDLLRHPDQLERLRQRPELMPAALEEILRLDPPAKLVGRVAAQLHQIDGIEIAGGQQVIVSLAAANRDPVRFSDPDTFDMTRLDFGHLSFGAGPHFCIGWGLARIEAEETLRRTFAAFPDLALVEGDPPRRDSSTFHALSRLRVRSVVGEGRTAKRVTVSVDAGPVGKPPAKDGE